MNDLQTLLQFLRGLPEVALLEAGVKELQAAGFDEDESEVLSYEVNMRAMDLQDKLDSLGINYQSKWGLDNSFSVRLGTNERTLNGHLLPGPVIADCRNTVGSYFTE